MLKLSHTFPVFFMFFCSSWLCCAQEPALVSATAPKTILPAHVFQAVAVLRSEIEMIRLEMGKPTASPSIITVKDAAPREVFFQARALFQKASRLALDVTREDVKIPPIPPGELRPKDVLDVVLKATERMQRVKTVMGIEEASVSPPIDSDMKPTDVYNSIIAASRELNILLDSQYSPGDVYREVLEAIAYASRILDTPGEVSTPPPPPPFERRKRPADVYRKLLDTFREVQGIGKISGVAMLEIDVSTKEVDTAEPSDVYDLATLIVAELAWFHSLNENHLPPRKVYNPGRKIPSDVFQKIGVLNEQVRMIRERVESQPHWLNNG